jgi:ubiquinone/menaquinone biosynthesis C-methylase UbiE
MCHREGQKRPLFSFSYSTYLALLLLIESQLAVWYDQIVMGENDVNTIINDMSAYGKPQRGFHGFTPEKHRIGHSYEKLLAHWDIPQGANVLDIGAGLGETAEFLHSLFNATVRQADLSMYPLALQRSDTSPHTQTDLLNAAALNLPFANHSFDAIHMKDVLVHIEDHAGFFGEMQRLLKPGGKLLIVTHKNDSIPYVLLLFANHNGQRVPPEQVAVFDSAGYADTVKYIQEKKMKFRGKKVVHISPPYFDTNLDHIPMIANEHGFTQVTTPYFERGWTPPKNEPDWNHTIRNILEFKANPTNITPPNPNVSAIE